MTEGHFIMIKGPIHYEDIILNEYALSKRASKYMKHRWNEKEKQTNPQLQLEILVFLSQ